MKKLRVNFSIDEVLMRRLKELSDRTMVPASAYVRKFLKEGLDRESGKPTRGAGK